MNALVAIGEALARVWGLLFGSREAELKARELEIQNYKILFEELRAEKQRLREEDERKAELAERLHAKFVSLQDHMEEVRQQMDGYKEEIWKLRFENETLVAEVGRLQTTVAGLELRLGLIRETEVDGGRTEVEDQV